ncbi:MAG: UDP-N-acetylmuramate dehydrogenase [Verrucomicrobiota bacterium]|nr:UDP-N-acetylmuramate dehydrogenase [Verrucomicrobiota bacterium]
MAVNIQTNRFLSEFSTFGIGGPIRYFLEVHDVADVQEAYRWAQSEKIPVLILGKGSNCLFSDQPYEGLVILNKIDFCEWEEKSVFVGAGYSFSLLGVQTARRGLSGLEFASGIPASVGGAIFMNAGANGQETCECLQSVTYLLPSGEGREYTRAELSFGYRTSPFQTMEGCILAARFELKPCETARKSQLEIVDYRMKTQPYKEKSAGCIFRNPKPGIHAGVLIDRSGLKGLQVGGAKVSEMHANFIVNAGGAKASDVLELIRQVQNLVQQKTGHHLEPEIRVIE